MEEKLEMQIGTKCMIKYSGIFLPPKKTAPELLPHQVMPGTIK